jgi:hypothetical protein
MLQEPVRHIVMCQFRQDTSDEVIEQIATAFRDLCSKIEGIESFEHGANNSPEGKSRGLTYAFVLTFSGAARRDAYLPHPEHRQFGTWLRSLGVLEDLLVFDYVPRV